MIAPGRLLMFLFLVAAIVLIVFALIAAASASGTCLGSAWNLWISAAGLAYLAYKAVVTRTV
jgi:hypothetical protein